MRTYLVMTTGSRLGAQFSLDTTDENLIGRGLECQVVLSDAQCSRVHASIFFKDDGWWIADSDSRNGTFVNEQKIDEAQLADGHTVRVGGTEFRFAQSEGNDTSAISQTVVFNEQVGPDDTQNIAAAALHQFKRADDFLTLYELAIKLLACDDPDEVTRTSLDLLQSRTKAAVVGFLWLADDGQLKPKMVIPDDRADSVELSQSLTELVCKEGRAIRVTDAPQQKKMESLRTYADCICVPMIHEDETVGAIHLYLDDGSFRDNDVEIARSLANILVAALVRARRQASLQVDHERLAEKTAQSDELIGESEPVLDLKSKIERVARATGCVLVRGESGSGKELVARALHRSSPRADRPMLSVNCAAIAPNLIESQLFGHKKGSFTSADSDHTGLFEQADSGTLFLDEVGELSLEGQAKLLRILEGHPFLPVGGTKEISVDVRVIAATNRDLREFVKEKLFREDLYYRLSVFELYIPPLRDRGPDIERLMNHFLDHFRRQHGRPNLVMTDEVRHKLMTYQWPGNVRQLRNVIDSAVVMALDDSIQLEDIGLRDASADGELESLRIDYWEAKLIKEALSRTSGSVPDAAKLVGLGRATIYRKIEEYGIEKK